jgi:hypothetical protein
MDGGSSSFLLKYQYPFSGFFGMGIASPTNIIAPFEIESDGMESKIDDSDFLLKNYISSFDDHMVSVLQDTLKNITINPTDTLETMYALQLPSLTFFSVRKENNNKNIYIDWSMRPLMMCINIIVASLLSFACDFAVIRGLLPDDNFIKEMRKRALYALGLGNLNVISYIICVAATKYEESQTYSQSHIPTFTLPTDVKALQSYSSHNIDVIVDTIFRAVKPLYLPASIANGYMDYHREYANHSVIDEWIKGKVVDIMPTIVKIDQGNIDDIMPDIVRKVASTVGNIFSGTK